MEAQTDSQTGAQPQDGITLVPADKTTVEESLSMDKFFLTERIDVYDVVGPDAHPSYGDAGKYQTVEFTVPENRIIMRLDQDCISGPCAWSYNPEGGGDIWYRLSEGNTKATWKRKHTSHPITYRIRVHWTTVN